MLINVSTSSSRFLGSLPHPVSLGVILSNRYPRETFPSEKTELFTPNMGLPRNRICIAMIQYCYLNGETNAKPVDFGDTQAGSETSEIEYGWHRATLQSTKLFVSICEWKITCSAVELSQSGAYKLRQLECRKIIIHKSPMIHTIIQICIYIWYVYIFIYTLYIYIVETYTYKRNIPIVIPLLFLHHPSLRIATPHCTSCRGRWHLLVLRPVQRRGWKQSICEPWCWYTNPKRCHGAGILTYRFGSFRW